MATTFGGLAFGIVTTDGFVPLPERALVRSVEHVPFSDIDIDESGGRGQQTLRVPVRIAFSALASWRALLGTVATLVIDGTGYGSMRLAALSNIRRTPRSEYVLADAEFGGG